MAKSNIESQSAALEVDIAQQKNQVASTDKPQTNWLTETFGVYQNFPEYDQVIKYGRKYRKALRPSAKIKSACILLLLIFSFSIYSQSSVTSTEKEAALKLSQEGKRAEAVRVWQKFLSQSANQQDADAWQYLGIDYYRIGNYKDAKKAFEKVIELRPNSDSAYSYYGNLLLISDEVVKASKAANQALKLNPENADATFILSTIEIKTAQPKESLKRADDMIRNKIGIAAAYLIKSQAYISLYGEAAPAWGTTINDSLKAKLLDLLRKASDSLEAYLNLTPKNNYSEQYRQQLEALSILLNNGGSMELPSAYLKPKITFKTFGRYTDAARNARVNGVVKLIALFASDGKIKFIVPVKKLEYGLTEVSLREAEKIQFTPAIKDRKPVSVIMILEYSYNTY
jgi:tetratricopeptide (TPR) repeat protein